MVNLYWDLSWVITQFYALIHLIIVATWCCTSCFSLYLLFVSVSLYLLFFSFYRWENRAPRGRWRDLPQTHQELQSWGLELGSHVLESMSLISAGQKPAKQNNTEGPPMVEGCRTHLITKGGGRPKLSHSFSLWSRILHVWGILESFVIEPFIESAETGHWRDCLRVKNKMMSPYVCALTMWALKCGMGLSGF